MSAPDVIALLASQLPDPGNPSFAPLCATLGMFIGGLVDHARRRAGAQDSAADKDGFLLGFGIGLACWAIVVAMDRL